MVFHSYFRFPEAISARRIASADVRLPHQALEFVVDAADFRGGQCKRTLPKGEMGATRGGEMAFYQLFFKMNSIRDLGVILRCLDDLDDVLRTW